MAGAERSINQSINHAAGDAIVDERENSVIPEVDRHACALIKSVLAINGTVRAPFILEPMFQIW